MSYQQLEFLEPYLVVDCDSLVINNSFHYCRAVQQTTNDKQQMTRFSCLQSWSRLALVAISLVQFPAFATDNNVNVQMFAQGASAISVNRPILKIGSQGTAVSELQAALKLLGYYSDAVDGIYRQNTAIAVSKFQQASGLNPDGVTGPDTWNRLFPSQTTELAPTPTSSSKPQPSPSPASIVLATTNPNNRSHNSQSSATQTPPIVDLPILKRGMKGSAVTQLQKRLKSRGFFKGTIDGVFGEVTEVAVKTAQQNLKIPTDGIVGSETWKALLR
jgi:N-acetylmuramoyl-L-alanine amidase